MKDNERILVVDDDLDFLDIIKRILNKKDFEVHTAPSGAEAISRLKERFCNVAILDISLPDADGTELLSSIIMMHPDIVAIMLTGHSSVQNAVKSLNCGAFAYLEKPLDPENLLSVINRGLEKQRLVLENRQLVEELERHNHISNTLLSISQTVSQSLDLQQIVDAALERVDECTGLEASFVYLHESDRLVLKGQHGLSSLICNIIPPETDDTHGSFGRVFRSADPDIMADLNEYEGTDLQFLKRGGYRCFAAIPLKLLGEDLGVLGVATSFANCFSPSIIELLTGIGREIAIAVRNAQLYEEASSAKALRELDTMRTEFLANVSHELRTPLAVIKGSANSLLQPDVIFDDQTRRDFLVSIDKDADTLTRLVDDLLTMSRLEADALEVKKKPRSLYNVAQAIKDRLDTLTTRHRLRIDIPPGLPLVSIDEGRITEVLTNLVENAAKFSDDNSTITITARPENKHVTVAVTDEGLGIPEEHHQKIFERFFQGNGRKAGRRKGTGLGLAICRGIIEAHGGEIWVESVPGNGATFSFTLPVE
ncbi:MAG: ATP-binding protein [Dehalococcoidales bacterium]|nr:ATP-binding protein [Dehalococcoidales bacterium]